MQSINQNPAQPIDNLCIGNIIEVMPAFVFQKFPSALRTHTAVVACCVEGFAAKQSPTTRREV